MGGTQALIENAAATSASTSVACPRCEEPWGASASLATTLISAESLRRCLRCGTRSTVRIPESVLLDCQQCGLPFLAAPDDESPPRCRDCVEGRIPADLPDEGMAAATEAEVMHAVGRAWSVVTLPTVADYLNRVARQVSTRIEGAPAESRVLLMDDRSVRTLALPSGTLMISLGMLAAIEDEAELVFVLGHELAHAASGDAAGRLVRLGLHAVSRDEATSAEAAWVEAALDLVRLGFGGECELEADASALQAMLGLGYDPESASRFLGRIESRTAAADPAVAEYSMAHPTIRQRSRNIELAHQRQVGSRGTARVNRELFRRAAGRDVLAADWVAVKNLDDLQPRDSRKRRGGGLLIPVTLVVVAALLVALGLLLYG